MAFCNNNGHASSEMDSEYSTDMEIASDCLTSTGNDFSDDTETDSKNILDSVYRDKSSDLHYELQQLQNRTNTQYINGLNTLEIEQENHLTMNRISYNSSFQVIEQEYITACHKAKKQFQERSHAFTESLIATLNVKKAIIKQDYLNNELVLDLSDQKPILTRKLRNRINNTPLISASKRVQRKSTTTSYLLREHEIEEDIKAIQESFDSRTLMSRSPTSTTIISKPTLSIMKKKTDSRSPPPTTIISTPITSIKNKKTGLYQDSRSSTDSMIETNDDNTNGLPINLGVRIESGKLLFEKRWYHRGQHIFVLGEHIKSFKAIITSIGNETIWVKNIFDNSKFHIFLSKLSNGELSIKRRAAI